MQIRKKEKQPIVMEYVKLYTIMVFIIIYEEIMANF